MTYIRLKTPLAQAIAIVSVSAFLGILFNFWLFGHLTGLAFPLYISVLAGGIFALAAAMERKPSQAAWWLTLPLVGFSAMVAVRSSELLTLMNLGACLLLLLLIAQVAFRQRLKDMRVAEYADLPFLPWRFLEPAKQALGRVLATHSVIKTKPMTGKILKGVAITVPVLAIFAALFASADLVVHTYLSSLINLQLDPELVPRLVFVAAVTLALTAGYSYLFGYGEPGDNAPEAPVKSHIGHIESTILLASVNTLFLAFIVVQLAYLFGGQANLAALGLTYAEYARKGFFELLAVAIVAFGLLWWCEKYIEKVKQAHATRFKVLSSLLILQVIVIMGSAFKRLYLYEQAYGFTTLRLYSHAFTVLLAVIFAILAYKIIRSASDRAFAFPMLLALIAFAASMNLINPDAFIARQNLARYQETGKIDVEYLRQLSDDAVPVLVEGLPSLKPDDATALRSELERQQTTTEVNAKTSWQRWNWSREQAKSALENK